MNIATDPLGAGCNGDTNLLITPYRYDGVSNSKLIIDNFKVKEIPALAKLLALASLQGIADLLTGEGIRFTDFEMNFTNRYPFKPPKVKY